MHLRNEKKYCIVVASFLCSKQLVTFCGRVKAFGRVSSSKRWVTVPCPLCRKRMKLPAFGTDFCRLLKVQPPQSGSNTTHKHPVPAPSQAASTRSQIVASSSDENDELPVRHRSHSNSTVLSNSCVWRQWDVCWANCEGYPYWPGVIVELRADDQLACVAFYDSCIDVAEAQWFSTQDNSIKAYACNREL